MEMAKEKHYHHMKSQVLRCCPAHFQTLSSGRWGHWDAHRNCRRALLLPHALVVPYKCTATPITTTTTTTTTSYTATTSPASSVLSALPRNDDYLRLGACFAFAKKHAKFSAMDRSGKRVLLVEDTEINRVLARRLLRVVDMTFDEAENGQAAVELVREGRTYDLILMDKEMPVMDGHEATRQIRSLGVTTPIVALSSNSLQSDRHLFIKAGADDFQPKPLSREKLAHVLAKFGLV